MEEKTGEKGLGRGEGRKEKGKTRDKRILYVGFRVHIEGSLR